MSSPINKKANEVVEIAQAMHLHLGMDYAAIMMVAGSTPGSFFDLKERLENGDNFHDKKYEHLVYQRQKLSQVYMQKIPARATTIKTRRCLAYKLMNARPRLETLDANVYYATLTVMITNQCTEDFKVGLGELFKHAGISPRHYFTCNAAMYEPDILWSHSPATMQQQLNKLLQYYAAQAHALLMHIDKIKTQYLNPNSHVL